MKLTRKIIELLQTGCNVSSHVSDEGIPYYNAECPDAHVAIWPHWNVVVCGSRTYKRFYVVNPAYKYVHSPEHVLDMAIHEQLETHKHAGRQDNK